jgi:hypothetical protein
MLKDIDIFITAFKQFDDCVTDERYKIITVKDFNYEGKLESYKDNVGDNISDMNGFFNELTTFYWIVKNYPMKEYVGMCSYRRYFSFLDDIDSIKDVLQTNDIILPTKEPLDGKTVFEHYDSYHNIKDLELALEILYKQYPSYKSDAEKVLNSRNMYCNNIFIMKREDFIKYCEFVFNILFTFLNYKNIKCNDDVIKYVMSNRHLYIKDDIFSKSAIYQARIGGFLAERLFNIFIEHNFKKKYEVPMEFINTNYSITNYFDEILLTDDNLYNKIINNKNTNNNSNKTCFC